MGPFGEWLYAVMIELAIQCGVCWDYDMPEMLPAELVPSMTPYPWSVAEKVEHSNRVTSDDAAETQRTRHVVYDRAVSINPAVAVESDMNSGASKKETEWN
ncbi:hypothetical protein SeLEV6574_g03592 [Synchytrium endobioticum]|uniref:Uncharacterized protein n=1 Tax=Synchytrium endobioticum TaxID=286115 RepID=A0A507D3S2_9FUNG|nr:hypothetical protein SeLEV6574_g03592 [Synchytrium endobioticum]